VGLDASSTESLNALYNKESVDEPDMARLLCLFRLEFINSTDTRPEFAGRNVYLAIAMNEKNELIRNETKAASIGITSRR
jgi:hypothetical protein